jgi:hypothetical protein
MRALAALALVAACGGLYRDPALDGVGQLCSSTPGCPPAEQCLEYAGRAPARCWGDRANGQTCPAGGAEIAWGFIYRDGRPPESWFACTLRCWSDADCLHGLRCHSPDQVCLPPGGG